MGRGDGGEPHPLPERRSSMQAGAEDQAYDPIYDSMFEFLEHDYDPRWDYTLRVDQQSDPLIELAQQRLRFLAGLERTPFERAHVFAAELSETGRPIAALYCSGTYCEPVVLVDLAAHRDSRVVSPEDEIRRSVDHEIVHAIQESEWDGEGEWRDEDEAESFQFPLGFKP